MAILNEILVARFARGLQKVFGIKGSAPVSSLAPEVMPVFPIPNGVEQRYADTWNRYAWALTLGPTAAQTNVARLLNPSGSNVIAVIEKLCLIAQGFDAAVTYGALPNLPSLTPVAVSLDGRNVASSTLIPSNASNSPALGTAQIWRGSMNTNVPYDIVGPDENAEIVLPPGFAISVGQVSLVNTQFFLSVFWRERFLEEVERI